MNQRFSLATFRDLVSPRRGAACRARRCNANLKIGPDLQTNSYPYLPLPFLKSEISNFKSEISESFAIIKTNTNRKPIPT
jgi:hypothetical protein